MTFPIFRTPIHWTSWLAVAIEAERLCVSSGMTKPEAGEFLVRQKPQMVAEFVSRFPYQVDTQLNNFQYSGSTGYNEGRRRRVM